MALITQAINGAVALSAAVKGSRRHVCCGQDLCRHCGQQGLNAALLACPITWIVVGVIALVAGIIALCNWIAKTTGVAATGFELSPAASMWPFKPCGTPCLWWPMWPIGIWNALGACCSNIGTAFHNVISNVQGWLYGLRCLPPLTVVEGICAALNKLPLFVEFDYSGISAKADEYAAKIMRAYGSVGGVPEHWGRFSPKGYNTFDTIHGWLGSRVLSQGRCIVG